MAETSAWAVGSLLAVTRLTRGCHVSQRQLVHHFTQVNLHSVLTGRYKNVALFVDTKVAGAPAVDVVELFGVIDGPFLHVFMGIMG